MSQLLQRLERELRNEQHGATRRAELSAQRAGYLARVGCFEEARQAVAELRKIYGDGHSGPITVWIMLAETMILFYENLHPGALDRVKRAQFLSELMQNKALLGLTSAWKAGIEFEVSRFDDMFSSLSVAKANALTTDHATGARFSMVLFNLFMHCGEFEQAQVWFMRCREHALAEGDQASIEALLYNRAALRMGWLRVQSCFKQPDDTALAHTRSEIASSRNYHDMTQVRGLSDVLALCEARMLVLAAKFDQAIPALQAIRVSKQLAPYNFSTKLIDLEIAYCQLSLNQPAAALQTFVSVVDLDLRTLDEDERLRALWMLKQLAATDSAYGDLNHIQAEFASSATTYQRNLDSLKTGLQNFRIDSSETNTSQPSALN
jgi:hypothetical protein